MTIVWTLHEDRIADQAFDDEAIIVMVKEQRAHTLNETGAFLWKRLFTHDFDELVLDLCTNFAVDEDIARQDALAFLRELSGLGILELRSSDPQPCHAEQVFASEAQKKKGGHNER